MPVRLNGSSSGFVELAAPAVAGSTTLELPTDSIKPGLVLVAQESFSAQSAVSVDSVFSAEYENYRVVMSVIASTGTPSGILRYRAAGTDISGAVYTVSQNYGSGANNLTAQTSILLASLSTEPNPVIWDVLSPFSTVDTHGVGLNQRNVAPTMFMFGHLQNDGTSVDGFTFSVSGATVTGSLSVYGYRNTL